MAIDDEFERIALENPELRDLDYAKVRAYRFKGRVSWMPLETFRGGVDRVKRGLLHESLPMECVLDPVWNLDVVMRINTMHAAGTELVDVIANHSRAEAARLLERQAYLLKMMASVVSGVTDVS